jgi:hypothetical protein
MPALWLVCSPQPLPHPHVICCCFLLSFNLQQEQQVPLVEVSLDLMQYMSDSFAGDAWVVPTMTTSQQPHAGTKGAGSLAACSSLMGSSCSSHSNQMVPDSPTCSSNSSQQQQQQDDCNMVGSSSEDATAAAAAAATTTTSSDSGSSSSMMLQRTGSHPQPAAGSCLSYDDDFVFQCYYGNPSSPANQQQQRAKQQSPFAAYAYVPGFSV